MIKNYVFDVDGTLTPSRQRIDPEFAQWFTKFAETHNVFLVTGSDYPKTLEQVGHDVMMSVRRVYNCSGNDVWEKGVNIRRKEFMLPHDLEKFMYDWLQASKFPLRTGTHVEKRPGTVNFSIVGRGASLEERQEYVQWDKHNRERETIAYQINEGWDDITAAIGGETGLDIFQTGCDKSQILVDFTPNDVIYFFGDAMFEGGNDWPLAQANVKGKNFPIAGWEHTWEILKTVWDEEHDNASTSWNVDNQYKKAKGKEIYGKATPEVGGGLAAT